MILNLNELLVAVSNTLDLAEIDLLGVLTNHGKRVAYICLKLAENFGMDSKQIHDVVSLGILHDNGASETQIYDRLKHNSVENKIYLEAALEHCMQGEKNVEDYPFFTDVKNAIKYHHEKYDGSGFFNLKGEEIPLISQMIELADSVDSNFNLTSTNYKVESQVKEFVKGQEGKAYSPRIVGAFLKISKNKHFWLDLNDNFINNVLRKSTPEFSINVSYDEIRNITKILSNIIDSKSPYTLEHSKGLAEKIAVMADYYGKNHEEKMKLVIAADLHDIGKLVVPNSILESRNKLTEEEFEIIKEHTYYTRLTLERIKGFEQITEWAANHHEKLDGSGYPYGKKGSELDFDSRLMACLDIYQALTENRPYRGALGHEETMGVLRGMKNGGLVDEEIVEDINNIFER
jgi:HD-GYP domain-containing protein (c-di-GMP phosphodiesterase class II)